MPRDLDVVGGRLSRRELLAAGAAAAVAGRTADAGAADAGSQQVIRRLDFSSRPDGRGWGKGWRTIGVANLRCAGGEGRLEAGSDVFPNDPRPVAFAVDCRTRDAEISASITRVGGAPGVVLRRTSPRSYYCAVYEAAQNALRLLARDGEDLRQLASVPAVTLGTPITLTLAVAGANPTFLRAELSGIGPSFTATAHDDTPGVQRAGDPGVLASAGRP
jgi:hypothetical protein